MRKRGLRRLAICVLLVCTRAAAIDLSGLRPIGPVASFTKDDSGVTLTCADESEVRISVLAPDLIRVRAALSQEAAGTGSLLGD